MQPSIYQQQVIKWLQNNLDTSDAIVNSVAGSGKSTLLKLAADAISHQGTIDIKDCMVLVFNKKNKEALVKKLDPRWRYSIATVHSAGYQVLKRYLGVKKLNVSEYKYRNLAKNLDWFNSSNPEQPKVISLTSFLKLANFVRLTLSPINPDSLAWLINHYALDICSRYLTEIGERLHYLFQMGFEMASDRAIIDHTDMLWLPVVWQIHQKPGVKLLKRLMVDEAQDMSKLQLEFVLTLVDNQGKMLFVGDPAQSINGFCGADTDSFANIQKRLQAKEFTLPVCYRCPQEHIQLINRLHPHIPIVPRNNAPLGSIEVIREGDLWDENKTSKIKPGDLVIARCSSSLVDLHLKIVVRGIPCNLIGSSLKQDLLELLNDIGEQKDFDYKKFAQFCQSYLDFKTSVYEQNDNKAVLLIQLQDHIQAIQAIYKHFSNCQSLNELSQNIEQLFGSEDDRAVSLSTVHRAKGMENERVYIAAPLTLPLLWENQKEWQERQEQNLLYVALSRSTKNLFLIGDAFWFEQKIDLIKDDRDEPNNGFDSVAATNIQEIFGNASSDELERYLKLIRLEQSKRISQSFQSLV